MWESISGSCNSISAISCGIFLILANQKRDGKETPSLEGMQGNSATMAMMITAIFSRMSVMISPLCCG